MGQKVHPHSLRLKINRTWNSKWFVGKREYADTLHEDLQLRRAIMTSRYAKGGDIASIDFIRQPQKISVIVDTARPGVLIGSKGENIEQLSSELQRLTQKKIQIKIKEIKQPEKSAQIIAINIARQLVQRSAFRRILKMAIENAVRSGVQGIKVKISGRLGGAEMSRSLALIRGRVPLHTLRAQIDYGFAEAFTTYGTIGVKVWIFNGEVLTYNTRQDAGQLLKGKKNSDSGAQRVPRKKAASAPKHDQAPHSASKQTPQAKVESSPPPSADAPLSNANIASSAQDNDAPSMNDDTNINISAPAQNAPSQNANEPTQKQSTNEPAQNAPSQNSDTSSAAGDDSNVDIGASPANNNPPSSTPPASDTSPSDTPPSNKDAPNDAAASVSQQDVASVSQQDVAASASKAADTGADTNKDTAAGTDTNKDTNTDTNTDTGVDTNTDTGADANTTTDTDEAQ